MLSALQSVLPILPALSTKPPQLIRCGSAFFFSPEVCNVEQQTGEQQMYPASADVQMYSVYIARARFGVQRPLLHIAQQPEMRQNCREVQATCYIGTVCLHNCIKNTSEDLQRSVPYRSLQETVQILCEA